ncbi:hypothetical protein [Anaplasma phagocytophilum]|uniref:hypothetical protein n=1 Tax=Anaplasma phagocytophilum TaxID=948 RepID=UPI00201AE3F5
MNGPLRFPKLKYLPLRTDTTGSESMDVSHLHTEVLRPLFTPTNETISGEMLDMLFYLKSARALLRRCMELSRNDDSICRMASTNALLVPIIGDVINMLTQHGGRIGHMSPSPRSTVRAFHEALLNIACSTDLRTIRSPQCAEYTKYLTAASIYVTQALHIFQEVHEEKVSDNQPEERCCELRNITRMVHVCRYLLVRLSAIQTVLPRWLLRLLINDFICTSSLVTPNKPEQYRSISVSHLVLRMATVMSLIKPALEQVSETQRNEAIRLYESTALVCNILLDKCLENVSDVETGKSRVGKIYDETNLLILGLNESMSLTLTIMHHWKESVKTDKKLSDAEGDLGILSIKNRLHDMVNCIAGGLEELYGTIIKSAGDTSRAMPNKEVAEKIQRSLAILKLMNQELNDVLPEDLKKGMELLGISLQRTLDRICRDRTLFDCCWDKKKCPLPVLLGELPQNRDIYRTEDCTCVFDLERKETPSSAQGITHALKSLVVSSFLNLTSSLIPIGSGPPQGTKTVSEQPVSKKLEVRLVDLLAELEQGNGRLPTDLRQQMLANADAQTASCSLAK